MPQISSYWDQWKEYWSGEWLSHELLRQGRHWWLESTLPGRSLITRLSYIVKDIVVGLSVVIVCSAVVNSRRWVRLQNTTIFYRWRADPEYEAGDILLHEHAGMWVIHMTGSGPGRHGINIQLALQSCSFVKEEGLFFIYRDRGVRMSHWTRSRNSR